MPSVRSLCAAVGAAAAVASASHPSPLGADPSGGWLSYAVYNAPQPTDVITRLSATMVVPDTPQGHLGSPAFWFGTQTAKGDGALIQPIMAKWLGDGFYMFHEIFDWTDERDEQSKQVGAHALRVLLPATPPSSKRGAAPALYPCPSPPRSARLVVAKEEYRVSFVRRGFNPLIRVENRQFHAAKRDF
jgi:hypothetical protein